MNISTFHANKFVADADKTRTMQRRYVDYFRKGETVADLGCGEGIFLSLLAEAGIKGVGVDLTPQFVEGIRQRGLDAHCADVFSFLHDHPQSFDGVIASHLIEHFPAERGLQLMQAMFDSLRVGGRMILITPTYRDILVSSERFWLDITHVRPYPLLLLKAVFEHLGLEVADSGADPGTRMRPSIVHLRSFVRYWSAKLRFGKYFDIGDTFIVGKKIVS
ncbi:MAG TPA: class I SAM-dependent methyltransferase [Bacteroidota bacterium]|nr:class I SAM-dependent methyltransferase [Bacteroidota bacterium]